MQRNRIVMILIIVMIALSACGGEEKVTPYPNEVNWETAIEILNAGDVESIFQLHNLEVTLLMKDGSEVHTIEPAIDAIFNEVEKCGVPCSNIMLATE